MDCIVAKQEPFGKADVLRIEPAFSKCPEGESDFQWRKMYNRHKYMSRVYKKLSCVRYVSWEDKRSCAGRWVAPCRAVYRFHLEKREKDGHLLGWMVVLGTKRGNFHC